MDAEQLISGRNKWAPAVPLRALRKLSSAVDPALQANFRPYFQPIVDGETGEIFAYEALLRIPGIATSDALFRRWESTGDVAVVDAGMVRRVRSVLKSQAKDVSVTINASALTVALAPENYLAEVERLVDVAQQVVVEVTETFPVLRFEQLVSFAQRCRALGAAFALDDCTIHHEYCNSYALDKLRPDILKLDGGMFTTAFNRNNGASVRHIVGLADSVGAKVVAEHVETASMAHFALAHGALLLQGYHFGRATALPEKLFPISA